MPLRTDYGLAFLGWMLLLLQIMYYYVPGTLLMLHCCIMKLNVGVETPGTKNPLPLFPPSNTPALRMFPISVYMQNPVQKAVKC